MKPSRFFYVLTGAAIASAALLPWPGDRAFAMFIFVCASAAALTFDWHDA